MSEIARTVEDVRRLAPTAGCVIERFGSEIVGTGLDAMTRHDDRPATWERAEALAGRALDRSSDYAIIDGEVCETVTWMARCSGCSPSVEDPGGADVDRGIGCSECRYRGRVRRAEWVPLTPPSEEDTHG